MTGVVRSVVRRVEQMSHDRLPKLFWMGSVKILLIAVAVGFRFGATLYGYDDVTPAGPADAQARPAPAAKVLVPNLGNVKYTFLIDKVPVEWAFAKQDSDSEDLAEEGAVPEQVRIDDGTFDRLLFHRESKIMSASDLLRLNLRVRIEAVDRSCGLTSEQRGKLSLAARGDVRRFLEKADELRQKYQERLVEMNDVRAQLALVRELSVDLEAFCRTVETASLRDDTLLAKTLRSCLSAQQQDTLLGSKVDPAVPATRSARFAHLVSTQREIEQR